MSFVDSFLFPMMCVMLLICVSLRKLQISLAPLKKWGAVILLSSAILIIPIKGIMIFRWIYSFNANFSILLQALVFFLLLKELSGFQLLSNRDFLSFWIFGVIGGLCLYPFAMGLGPIDPYTWGYSWNGFFVFSGFLTVALIMFGYKTGFVLLIAIGAYITGFLESNNFWDYLLDPFYFLISIFMLLHWLFRTSKGSINSDQSTSAVQQ